MPTGPQMSAQRLRDDMLSGYYRALVAIDTATQGGWWRMDRWCAHNAETIGYVLFYYAYSTWQGRFAFMEDLYVTPRYRRRQIGRRLFARLADVRCGSGAHVYFLSDSARPASGTYPMECVKLEFTRHPVLSAILGR
jgi:GNAT superfamily N-acetyltransferase